MNYINANLNQLPPLNELTNVFPTNNGPPLPMQPSSGSINNLTNEETNVFPTSNGPPLPIQPSNGTLNNQESVTGSSSLSQVNKFNKL